MSASSPPSPERIADAVPRRTRPLLRRLSTARSQVTDRAARSCARARLSLPGRGRRALAPLWRARGDGSDAHQLPQRPCAPRRAHAPEARRTPAASPAPRAASSTAGAITARTTPPRLLRPSAPLGLAPSRPGTATWLDRRVNGADRTARFPRRPRAAHPHRVHDHRLRGDRLPARRDDRGGRRGATRLPPARGPAAPDA